MDAWEIATLATAAVSIILGFAFLFLLRQMGELELRLERIDEAAGMLGVQQGPPLGRPETTFRVFDQHDRLWTFGGPASRPTLILFLSPRCSACTRLLEQVRTWPRQMGGEIDLVVVSSAEKSEVRRYLAEQGFPALSAVSSAELLRSWKIQGVPFAVLIDRSGSILSTGWAYGVDDLDRMLLDRGEGGGAVGGKKLEEAGAQVLGQGAGA